MGDPRVAAVPAHECGDELVDTRTLAQLRVAVHDGPPSAAYPFVRRSLAERLLQAQGALPEGLHLLVVEGYRPYELQEFYFTRHKQRLLLSNPALTEGEAFLAASQFVSPPQVAPHVSGAAVDLTLVDGQGQPLDMGTDINASPEESDGACYFAATNITTEARRNRDIFAAALSGAGMTNYPTEWWHWSYGDRYWALLNGCQNAIFGPLDIPTQTPTRV